MQQLTIFDYPAEQKHIFQIHDKVRLQLVDEAINFEIYNYRKYYCEHLIGKMGTVLDVKGNTVTVQINGVTIPCDASELEWIV